MIWIDDPPKLATSLPTLNYSGSKQFQRQYEFRSCYNKGLNPPSEWPCASKKTRKPQFGILTP